jgi:hypothetical protein
MPRNLDRLDLTRPARRALLGRLLDIIDGEDAVFRVYCHAKRAAEALAKAESDPSHEHRDALTTEALSSARAVLPALDALVVLAEADAEQTRSAEASYRRWHDEKPGVFATFEKELARREDDIARARRHAEEMRAIITAHAPDEDLVGKHSADLAEAISS